MPVVTPSPAQGPGLDAELAAIFEEELTEELAADEVVLLEAREAGSTMEISAEEIEAVLEETPLPAVMPVVTPAVTPVVAPAVTRACVPASTPAETRPCVPESARAVPVRELPELPSTASSIRPLSESTWSVATLHDDDIGLPRRSAWWRYTAISAGATALVCALGFTLAGEPAPASAAARPTEPVVVAYDPSALAQDDEPDVAAPEGHDDDDRLLARRIALRGTRNLDAGRTRLARDAFKEALSHDSECRPALAGLGRIYFEAGRHKKAADLLATAVRLEPRDAELQSLLAQAYHAIGHHQSAARHERRAARHGR